MRGSKVIPKHRFQLVLIKPSHYGDDGYVIRWWRSMIPSMSWPPDCKFSETAPILL
jgi:hypothetical protein